MPGLHREVGITGLSGISQLQRQTYLFSVWEGSVPGEMEKGHSRVPLPQQPFSPFF